MWQDIAILSLYGSFMSIFLVRCVLQRRGKLRMRKNEVVIAVLLSAAMAYGFILRLLPQ